MTEPPADFDGRTFNPQKDGERLTAQLATVRSLMLDGQWRTLREIAASVGAPEASISARLRDLRKSRFGGYLVLRRRVDASPGLWEYRVTGHDQQVR